jgi:hypothetical protein
MQIKVAGLGEIFYPTKIVYTHIELLILFSLSPPTSLFRESEREKGMKKALGCLSLRALCKK